jgi:hypothetical protein
MTWKAIRFLIKTTGSELFTKWCSEPWGQQALLTYKEFLQRFSEGCRTVSLVTVLTLLSQYRLAETDNSSHVFPP